MKIKIQKHTTVETEIEVEFPYYFKHDLTNIREYVIYGKKLSPQREVTIRESFDGYNSQYEIEESHMSSSYFDEEHKSNRGEFEAVKSRALEFLQGL